VELREPFLDYRLVEFAFAQPAGFKIREGEQKYMLREILKPLVHKDISYAPKRPLQTPQREWLAEDLKEFTASHLENLETSKYPEWFNHKEIQKEWQGYLDGDNESSFHIWQWVNASLLFAE
jgi:asparagine synthase (glutamine-hydrolysing)